MGLRMGAFEFQDDLADIAISELMKGSAMSLDA